MSQMLHNFGFSTKIKLIFEESSELSSKRLGEFRNNHNNNSYRILLDVTNLPHYSKEVIVSSIYHEVLHAQLEFLFKETESQDHERMATEYLERAVNSLLKQFSNMNKDTAKALVFSGLKNTKIYQNLNQETKNQMYEIESNFKNRNYGTYCD